MRRVMSLVGIIALIAVLSPTSALAKGPSSASIDGPGTGGGIDVTGEPGSGEPGSSGTLANLAEHAGLFAVGFGMGAGRLSDQRPDGELGPELTVEFTVPGPDAAHDVVVQRLYPWADGGAVTYTEEGQSFMGMETMAGWYAGGERLSTTLTEVGLPEQPPSQRPALIPIAVAIIIACALGVLAMVALRAARHRRETVEALARS